MTNRMTLVILPTLLAWPLADAAAQDPDKHRCTFGSLERRIEIYREPGLLVPCEVHYYKDTEAPGEQQVLWRAQNEEGFCEARVDEFLTQLSDWGWDCSAGAELAEPEEPAAAEPPIVGESAEESID